MSAVTEIDHLNNNCRVNLKIDEHHSKILRKKYLDCVKNIYVKRIFLENNQNQHTV